ncbi:MAG: hypothetical protein DHS20C18_37530 [Saprospiraceae bacterium]|nr:MAG: hypothetical protein DHS20C18_37530 [Saprospiraceae bacterium]
MKYLYLIVITTSLLFFVLPSAWSQNCTAGFSFGETALTIQFTDQSTSDPGDPIVSWAWDFDDDNFSTQPNPSHTFSEADDYDVCLVITTQSGCTDEICIEIEICVLELNVSVGACNGDNEIPITINVSDPFDAARSINISIDGLLLPGSPFDIDDDAPVTVNTTIPGDGLEHNVLVQSEDVGTCSASFIFTVPDCSSDCFLSSMSISTAGGTTHIVQIGDNFFSPVNTTITVGDITEFQWVGDGHSTTSDATSGPDSWNSGVIGFGSVYQVNIKNPGTHRYYCIPHGGPGGVGMSGTIIANCPSDNQFNLIVNFNTSIANAAGFDVLLDGNIYPGSPFSYNGTGPQSVSINLAGDGSPHTIEIRDVADPSCTITRDYTAPDCGAAPSCSLSLTASQTGACDAANNVGVEITVNSINAGPSGFNVLVDGNLAVGSPFSYNGSGITIVNVSVPGDGQSHTIQVQDVADNNCAGSTTITTQNCTIPCQLSNLVASTGNATTHVVEVRDFEFFPRHITITSGDIVAWQWTGTIAHTSTSDAVSGPDSWDSGLLNQGASYQSPVLSAGVHPYYCIPHGGPGGVGMSGTITVQADCTNGQVSVGLSFTATGGGFGGYQVLVDGNVAGSFSYDASGNNTASVLVAGDGQSHTIVVQDIDDNSCSISTSVTTPDCNASTCQLGLETQEETGCDDNNNVTLQLTITDMGGGASGFQVLVDGNVEGTYAYSGSGATFVSQTLPGDGQSHLIEVRDIDDPSCSANQSILTTDCSAPCELSNLEISIGGSGGPVVHTIEVLDFEFQPRDLIINVGDIVRWDWVGTVPHTATSDATTGNNVWNSGLLGQGAIYEVTITEPGVHPYYCIPHGGPGGIGMSGTITAQGDCDDGNINVNISFQRPTVGGGTYNVLVDGSLTPESPYSYENGSLNQVLLSLPGQGQSVQLVIQDVNDPACHLDSTIVIPDCSDPCFGFNAGFAATIDHLTFEVSFASLTTNAIGWDWDFGNGAGSQLENPNYTYPEAGNFEVCLTAMNAEGCADTYCETILIGEYLCEAAFSVETEGLTISFSDESVTTDEINQWTWQFGDTSGLLNEQNPVHTFDTLGIYDVCLSIEAGLCVTDTCVTLNLTDPCLLFQAAFSYSINETDLSVQFTDQTSGNAHQWLWGFGNGITSNEQHPFYVYDTPGDYTICLLVQDTLLGCNRSHCEVIHVGTTSVPTTNINQRELVVFPNPVLVGNTHWTIKGLQTKDIGSLLELSIYDIRGKTIFKDQLIGRESLTFGAQQSIGRGIYFLEIRSDGIYYRGKLMVL